ncbi:MAG: hypothetical protein RIC89_12595 [Pseudomonadales bacterium]
MAALVVIVLVIFVIVLAFDQEAAFHRCLIPTGFAYQELILDLVTEREYLFRDDKG